MQEVIAHLFDLSQGQANFLIHELSAVLQKTLENMKMAPARLSNEMMARLQNEMAQAVGIDGTERRINRPVNSIGQTNHYSGKKKPMR